MRTGISAGIFELAEREEMFTKEQQQLFNQAYNAWQNVTDFVRKCSGSNADREQAFSDLQMQGYLTRIALAGSREPSDDEQMFIRSLIMSTPTLRDEIPGYGKYFLNINRSTYEALSDTLGAAAQKVPFALDMAQKRQKAGDRRCVDAVLTEILLVLNSFLALVPDTDGSRRQELTRILQIIKKDLTAKNVKVSSAVSEILEKSMQGKGLIPGGTQYLDPEEYERDSTIAGHMDELTSMIQDSISALHDKTEKAGGTGNYRRTISSLVNDLFGTDYSSDPVPTGTLQFGSGDGPMTPPEAPVPQTPQTKVPEEANVGGAAGILPPSSQASAPERRRRVLRQLLITLQKARMNGSQRSWKS